MTGFPKLSKFVRTCGGFPGVALGAGLLVLLIGCQPTGGTPDPSAPVIDAVPTATHHDRVMLIGSKSPGTGIIIDGFQRVGVDNRIYWAVGVALVAEGANTFVVESMDDLGHRSEPVSVVIQLDTTPPDPPTVFAPATSPSNPVTITGTKEARSFVRLNGRRISSASDATDWTYDATLVQGLNTLTITSVDEAGNESDPVGVDVTLTSACGAPPRPIFPLDGNAIQWGRAFSWTQAPPSGNYLFELSTTPAFGAEVILSAPGLISTQFVPGTAAPDAGVYYWRVGATDSCGTSYGLARKVVIGSTTGDVTGDGYADIFVGAPGDDQGDVEAGAAYLYQGDEDPELLRDAVVTGQGRASGFGTSVAKVGDIDRDGYVDLLVGAYAEDSDESANDNAGAAYLYWGGAAIVSTPALVFRGAEVQGFFGVSVAGLGDVNGDGHPDVAVGAHRSPVTATCGGGASTLSMVGRVDIFFGGSRTEMDAIPDVILTGETTMTPGDPTSACREGDEFGSGVAGIGDVNGDGYDDIAVGARGYDDSAVGVDAGRVYVFFGGPWLVGVGAERADVIRTGTAAGDEFGTTVAGARDMDGDGFADLLVGAPLRDGIGVDTGSVSWYFGRGAGVSVGAVEVTGAAAEERFGFAVAGAGDLNADGYADAVVGSFLAGPTDNGAAVFLTGNASRNVSLAAGVLTIGESEPKTGDQLGISVGGAGDVNGDGFDDTVLGAWHHDECLNPLTQGEECFDPGRAYVILGLPPTNGSVVSDLTAWLLSGTNPGDGLGLSVR